MAVELHFGVGHLCYCFRVGKSSTFVMFGFVVFSFSPDGGGQFVCSGSGTYLYRYPFVGCSFLNPVEVTYLALSCVKTLCSFLSRFVCLFVVVFVHF